MHKVITHGYGLVLPLPKVERILCLLMVPMNIQKQNMINKLDKIVGTDHLTHDQNYKWSSRTPVNIRINKVVLLPCLTCIINWAIAAGQKYPNQQIIATKIDYKSAYQRYHLNAKTAIQTCT